MALVQNIKAWSHRINNCTFYSLSPMPYIEYLFSWFKAKERNSTGLTYIFTNNIIMFMSYNFTFPKPIFRIWLMANILCCLACELLWWEPTFQTGTFTSHCIVSKYCLSYLWYEIIFKISWSVDLPEGLPTYIPLCISGLTSLKNLREDPFLYLKKFFLHLQSVACT